MNDADCNADSSRRWARATLGLLIVHGLMLTWNAVRNSPVYDEVAHLAAGIHCWQTGRFHVYRVNPPLVKLVAALPAVVGDAATGWEPISDSPLVRSEFVAGRKFLDANGPAAFRYVTAGRIMCLPFSLLGGWMCFVWGRALYNPCCGWVACLLWCFSPNILGWGATFTPDVAAASVGAAALYTYRRWLRNGSIRNAFQAGFVLGLAELVKMTWVILFPLYIVLWWSRRRSRRQELDARPSFLTLLLLMVIAIGVLNIGYGFEGSMTSLGDYEFVSQTLSGHDSTGIVGNRFRESFFSGLPVPLPRNFLRGMDLQKVDFEQRMESYLLGEWSDSGWWYYYLVATAFKVPAGTLALFFVACVAGLRRSRDGLSQRDAVVLWLPACAVIVLVSSQTGVNRYFRYMLPALPAMFVVTGGLWQTAVSRSWRGATNAVLILSVLSSLAVYPYSLSYFNMFAGGPLNGHRILLDANIDWGQDLFRLKSWLEAHPQASLIRIIHSGFVTPREVGIQHRSPDAQADVGQESTRSSNARPAPGWYAVSVHELFNRRGDYAHFRTHTPVDRIGFSMWIYRVE